MNAIQLLYDDITFDMLKKSQQYQSVITKNASILIQAQDNGYDTIYASLHSCTDSQMINTVENLAAEKRLLQPCVIIVIGMGGSSLGAQAIIQAVYGDFYQRNDTMDVYFIDTLDGQYTGHIISKLRSVFASGLKAIINVVTKSGDTLETVLNFHSILDVLQEYFPESYKQYIVITTEKHSPLYEYAKNELIDYLIIPNNVVGRFSVFSAAGLFPVAMMGIDIFKLCSGAMQVQSICCDTQYEQNKAAAWALITYSLYRKSFDIHNMFLFSRSLKLLGDWYRQLMAESLGKMYDLHNAVVNEGILPTVSIGPSDLHSVAQLYLSGPYNIFTTFVSCLEPMDDVVISKSWTHREYISEKFSYYSHITDVLLEGTKKAYIMQKRPFIHIKIPEQSPYYIGQYMQICMYQIIYLAALMNIDPFNQPQVELYKKETKKILMN